MTINILVAIVLVAVINFILVVSIVEKHNKQNTKLVAKVDGKDRVIKDLQGQLDEKQRYINGFKNREARHEKYAKDLLEVIETQNRIIESLEAQANSHLGKLKNADRLIDKRVKRIKELEKQLELLEGKSKKTV